jgi:hypothetical protein
VFFFVPTMKRRALEIERDDDDDDGVCVCVCVCVCVLFFRGVVRVAKGGARDGL